MRGDQTTHKENVIKLQCVEINTPTKKQCNKATRRGDQNTHSENLIKLQCVEINTPTKIM